MVFVNAVVLDDLVGALADSGKLSIGGPRAIPAVLVPQDPDNKLYHLGLGSEIIDTPGEEDVTDRDGRDAGLVFAAQSQVNFSGRTDVGDKVLGGESVVNTLDALPRERVARIPPDTRCGEGRKFLVPP